MMKTGQTRLALSKCTLDANAFRYCELRLSWVPAKTHHGCCEKWEGYASRLRCWSIDPDHWILDQGSPGPARPSDLSDRFAGELQDQRRLLWSLAERLSEASAKNVDRVGLERPVFIQPGAEAYLKDIPEAKLVLLDAGHFVLDEDLHVVTQEIVGFFGQ